MFNFWDWDKEQEFFGTFRGQYKAVGKFKKNVYYFITDKKKGVHVWGLVQINNLFYGVPFGVKVRLKYLGMEKMPESARLFKNFELEILGPPTEGEIPEPLPDEKS